MTTIIRSLLSWFKRKPLKQYKHKLNCGLLEVHIANSGYRQFRGLGK